MMTEMCVCLCLTLKASFVHLHKVSEVGVCSHTVNARVCKSMPLSDIRLAHIWLWRQEDGKRQLQRVKTFFMDDFLCTSEEQAKTGGR